jgi:hypothetical protein
LSASLLDVEEGRGVGDGDHNILLYYINVQREKKFGEDREGVEVSERSLFGFRN